MIQMLQGKLVQRDFNIEEEAGGVGKKVVKRFKKVVVTNNTLEIRLYWAGKGREALPDKSVYGPLISAISAKSGRYTLYIPNLMLHYPCYEYDLIFKMSCIIIKPILHLEACLQELWLEVWLQQQLSSFYYLVYFGGKGVLERKTL
jgi:hypothetical protein